MNGPTASTTRTFPWLQITLALIFLLALSSIFATLWLYERSMPFPPAIAPAPPTSPAPTGSQANPPSNCPADPPYAVLGTLGDFFGGMINPWLSFLSLLALFATIIYQAREFKLSRDALDEQLTATREQGEAQREQGKSLKQQNFEQTFFQVLALHSSIINGMHGDGQPPSHPVAGRAYLQTIYDHFLCCYADTAANAHSGSIASDLISRKRAELKLVEAAYARCYDAFRHDLSYYFQHIHAMLRVLDQCPFQPPPPIYALILRAQLSTVEVLLLFYHALWRHDANLTRLINDYGVLALIDERRLPPSAGFTHIGFYEPTAYHDLSNISQETRKSAGWYHIGTSPAPPGFADRSPDA